MKRSIVAAGALFVAILVSADALAWFKVCNRADSGMWVSYAHHVPNTGRLHRECIDYTLSGGCYYSSWEVNGWWRVEPNQCVTVYQPSISNRYSYLHAEFDDGAYVSDGPSFSIRDQAYSWDQYEQSHNVTETCIEGIISGPSCTVTSYYAGHRQIDTGGAANYTYSIY